MTKHRRSERRRAVPSRLSIEQTIMYALDKSDGGSIRCSADELPKRLHFYDGAVAPAKLNRKLSKLASDGKLVYVKDGDLREVRLPD